jgi:GxxExxY protein
MKSREEIEALATLIVDCILKVHRALGPGLLESTYQICLAHELRGRGMKVQTEVMLPVRYAGIEIEAAYRIDMLVKIASLSRTSRCRRYPGFLKHN